MCAESGNPEASRGLGQPGFNDVLGPQERTAGVQEGMTKGVSKKPSFHRLLKARAKRREVVRGTSLLGP